MEHLFQNIKSVIRIKLGELHSELLHVFECFKFRYSTQVKSLVCRLKILDTTSTINYIIEHKCSVSRFGDGEFYVLNGGGNDFQQANAKLQLRLKEVLSSSQANLLLSLPYAWKDCSHLRHGAKVFFMRFVVNHHEFISKNIDMNKLYGDALFTRFYIDYKARGKSRAIANHIMEIWSRRHVYIIEGKFTRMGMGNGLFDNALSVHRILGPSHNAFEKYDEIMATVQKYVPKDNLVLIAMGMTATVMAYDLSGMGYQAIDIGHMDVEYEWMRMRAKDKVAISNRFVNEANNYMEVSGHVDAIYKRQIIAMIE